MSVDKISLQFAMYPPRQPVYLAPPAPQVRIAPQVQVAPAAPVTAAPRHDILERFSRFLSLIELLRHKSSVKRGSLAKVKTISAAQEAADAVVGLTSKRSFAC